MSSQTAELSAYTDSFYANAPKPVQEALGGALADLNAIFDPKTTIQAGQKLPEFRLPNVNGEEVSSTDLLKNGPLLITFYRGEWCPFCNIALQYLQRNLDKFKERNTTLVAISPELPDQSLTTTEKNALKFPVLSDIQNKFAKQLGIVFYQPESLRPIFEQFGHDFKKRNGDDSLEVPIPATILVDQEGIVRNIHLDTDWKRRLEPSEALAWIDALKA